MTSELFHVSGMHCKACVTLVEGELMDRPDIEHARASLARHQVSIAGPILEMGREGVITALAPVLEKHGYQLSLQRPKPKIAWREFLYAVPGAIAFLALFYALQRLGIVNLVSLQGANYASAFFIGIIASLSTCMAVVGGLTLSVTANFAKEGSKLRPQLLFHAGRLASFFLLGGVIGAVGTQFSMSGDATLFLNLVVAAVMLTLGVNLLDVLPSAKGWQLTLPASMSRRVDALKQINHTVTPALLGAATFFLPCGFTQSMQLYTLTAGSFSAGALTMGLFALGTLPVLGLLSFASFSLHSARASGIFFKTSGLIVIAFAVLNLLTALMVAGYISPLPRFS